jgi:hypothetical protein
VSGLAQAAHRLHPPERFFDAFALDRANAIAGMAGRTRIDRRPAVGVVLRDVRRAAAFATASDEVSQDAAEKFGKSDVTIRRAWQRFGPLERQRNPK